VRDSNPGAARPPAGRSLAVPVDHTLATAAARALAERGFDFTDPPVATDDRPLAGALPPDDLRALLWSSVDDASSRDLDQVEVAEALPDGAVRLLVGVADVDALVPAGSPVDAYARGNATSVYAGAAVYGMLPETLSAGATSLLDGGDRLAVVVTLEVDAAGAVRSAGVRRALVRNRAKLAYEEVGRWLAGDAPGPGLAAALAREPGLVEQLRLQDAVAVRLRATRRTAGALDFDTQEARAVRRDGELRVEVVAPDRARDLIEAFMVAANVAVAEWLAARGRSAIVRVLRAPERWHRIAQIAAACGERLPDAPDGPALAAFLAHRRTADPAGFAELSLAVVKLLGGGEYAVATAADDAGGHFPLASRRYAHATAPNRRYADLVTQRLVKAALAGAPAPYTDAELAELARHCTSRESAARAVERQVRKSAAALVLAPCVGERFDAVVTGTKATGTFVRLVEPPAEGRVVRGEAGLDVGDRVRVRLLAADPEHGFLDFAADGVAEDAPPRW
jgi:exoribonuclease-2